MISFGSMGRAYYDIGDEVVLRVNAEIGYIHDIDMRFDDVIYEIVVITGDDVFLRKVLVGDISLKTGTVISGLFSRFI